MPIFLYTAFNKAGSRVQGTIDATTTFDAKQKLSIQGLYPILIQDVRSAKPSMIERVADLFRPAIAIEEVVFFTHQLNVLLKAGIPLLSACDLLINQLEGRMVTVVVRIRDLLKEGTSFADSLSYFPKVFSQTYVQLVRAGEASGQLEMILDNLASYLERTHTLSKRVKSALRTPLMQLGLAAVVVTMLLVVVVPQLQQTFTQMKIALPVSTRVMIATADFLMAHGILLLMAGLVLAIAVWAYRRTAQGQIVFDKLVLKLPIVGYIMRMQTVVDFCRTLGLLLQAGVSLSESLDIVIGLISNKILLAALSRAREQIIKQGKLAYYLEETGLFPPIAIYLITTGEQSGTLDKMLLQVADYYEEQLGDYMDNLVSRLGPGMLLLVGALIGGIVMAIAQPMMQLNQGLSQM